MTENAAPPETKVDLTREEKAFFIKAFWEALIAPQWSRDTLIELGKVVFAKVPLGKLTDEQFALFIPKLQEIADSLGTKIIRQAQRVTAPSGQPSPATPSAPEPAEKP